MSGLVPVDEFIGEMIASRYVIEVQLGEGAMGSVYRARHQRTGRRFAIKILHKRLLSDDKIRLRFEREAELVGKLRHPNVVGVIDVGDQDGLSYMVMEYADGPSLATLIGNPMPANRVRTIIKQLCDGLDHAHELGLIHRDLKPDNIIIERDRYFHEVPRIIDFGIALLREEASSRSSGRGRLTSKGIVLGTPIYMAPEQAMGEDIDHRADLFALGVICYEMLTGRGPFEGSGVDVAQANMTKETPPMGVRVPELIVDPLLEAFTRKLLRKNPDHRFRSAAEARAMLLLIEQDRKAAARELGIKLPTDLSFLPVAARKLLTDSIPRLKRKRSHLFATAMCALGIAAGIAVHPQGVAESAAVLRAEQVETLEVPARIAAQVEPAPPPPPPVVAPVAVVVAPPVVQPAQRPAEHARQARAIALTESISPSALATLYATVGHDLRVLAALKGQPEAADLWPRYRRVRLSEALATASARDNAAAILEDLQREIATRSSR